MTLRIGTAGWSVSRTLDGFPAEGTGLERYAARFDAVEINSSFYRPHQRKTYERWAAGTPADFRFAVKVPKTITHERRLVDCAEPLARFMDEYSGLGEKLGPLLIQLPPSLKFDTGLVSSFLAQWRTRVTSATALEPRHASWFADEAETLLARFEIARVAADPAVVPEAAEPASWPALTYRRLHGSPTIYESAYGEDRLKGLAARLVEEAKTAEVWCVFDNTKFGAATTDAQSILASIPRLSSRP